LSAYRFCRSDDIGLLVDALNRCWSPYFPDEPPMTPEAFKRSIRDLQVWCSSCMVAFSGADPIGVLIGAKRPSGTLIHRIAVHPDHVRQGHGRHLLTSLSSKLAILGPPRMVAEVAETFVPACALFNACGYAQEAVLTDYALDGPASERDNAARVEGFVIPVTVDDLVANDLLGPPSPSASAGQEHQVCWERSVETLTARKDDLAGFAVASDERIEAYILYMKSGVGAPQARPAGAERGNGAPASDGDGGSGGAKPPGSEIVSLRSFVEDGGSRLKQLLAQLHARGTQALRFPKVHPAEFSKESLEALGFSPAGGHLRYAAKARSD
jgi:GNAT superfamily N-acetyltransferase